MSDDLLDLATEIATRAGELILRRRHEGVTVAATKSSAVDVVTLADRESEDLIRSLIADARPGDGFLGEESDATSSTTGITWVVDPIDGTVNYLYDIPNYAVSIAVVEGDPDPQTWTALAATVVNPAAGETFSAARGAGATLNGASIRANAEQDTSLALLGTGFAYSAERRVWQAGIVQHLIGQVRDIRRMGSAELDLCSVACGRLDGYYERGLNPWDHAAGALIAQEAGARVEGLHGTAASSDFTLATAPGLFDALHEMLLEAGAEASILG
ncbi:MAG: inositol monophosphatase family protein [Leifsonia flava]